MVYEYALLTTAPEQSAEFEASFPEAIAILRSSPGCHDVELQAAVDRPGIYLLKVGWSRVEDHVVTFA
ncbi:antibiotic biosynthesis monooxygenase family protein [Microbacterium sp. BR1]|uniref:antibiotic biosynthesis monooxygenase family protein n=1 Tax=Microbacterium sp. BR1 TaxID=1070896 RepID=UPI000C2CB3D4|nr:antibiotic biosynthesis monooxygenase [Microbacterium sp. BR1]